MIAWKAKWGYVENRPDTPNFSAITWTDETLYSFAQNVQFVSDKVNGQGAQTGSSFKHKFTGDEMESVFGKDYYFITMIIDMVIGPNNISIASNLFSSIKTIAPNLYNEVVQDITKSAICYIPGLDRYLYYRSRTTSTRPNIYDGNGTLLWSSESFLGVFSGQTTSLFPIYNGNSIDKDSLLDITNWIIFNFSGDKYYVNSCTTSNAASNVLSSLFSNYSPPDYDIPNNPYEPGGPSVPGGGNGSFDNDSDQIVDSSIPTISSANTGFTRIYNPSLSQVQSLARYLWTDENVIQTIWNHIKQYFEDPMQAIIGFNLVPVPVPKGGTQNFALMYIDTGVEMTVAASQFVDVDCGTFELKEYYGSALDYAPNTKVSCFLPFIGTVSLNTDEVMGRTLQVKYRVDICSGSCVAKIGVDGNFIYQYSGHCAINIPISSADFSSYVSSAISVAQLVGSAIAAGAGGVMASTAVDASQQTNQVVTTTQITNTARNPATGRQITTGTMTRVETRESPNDQSSTQASFSGLTPQNISNTVGQIMSSKPNINHSGSFSGNSGYLGVRRPFLIIERPNMCMPSNFQALNGFPSMITLELSSCKGFTRVQQVQLTGFYATNPEQAEILQLLKSGVIL